LLYFAYGSNLDPEQMKKRCPDCRFKCRALLPNHRLAFTRYSESRGGGVADVVEETGSAGVWGVVYEISEEDLRELDRCEGYYGEGVDNAYDRCRLAVLEDGDGRRSLEAWVYRVHRRSGEEYDPTAKYLSQIITGAEHWGLPEHYIESLKSRRSQG
jgi:gamma-glutamylcyclotransferase (GGCT)/AIG2-like uncharacterized protein YtfP